MKPIQFFALLALGCFFLWGFNPGAHAYTVTLQPGPNLVANHLNHTPNNGLNNIFPSGVPASSSVWSWDVPLQKFTSVDTFSAGTWVNNYLLNPGAGALFFVNSASSAGFSISGTAASGSSVSLTPGLFVLAGNATPNAGTVPGSYASIAGGPPSATGTTWLLRWDAAAKTYVPYRFVGGTWTPSPPSVPVGESVFIGNFSTGLAAPNIVSAVRSCDVAGSFIRVKFDTEVDPLTAAVAANFTVTGGSAAITAAEPEFDPAFVFPMPLPKVRSVRLRLTGLGTPALLTFTAPGVKGMGGTPVNPASSAQTQTALTVVQASMDCFSDTLCLTFNQDLDDTAASFTGNYTVNYTDLATAASGTLSVFSADHYPTNIANVVCLNLSAPPAGDLLFTVELNSATVTPLVSTCGVPLAVTPIFTVSTKCNPVVNGRIFRHQSAPECSQDLGTGLYGIVPNEYPLLNWDVKLDDGIRQYVGMSDVNGDFHVSAPPGDYTLYLNTRFGWTQRCPVSGGIPVTLTAGNSVNGADFAAEPDTIVKDLSIFHYPFFGNDPVNHLRYSSPCCGQPMTLIGYYINRGTEVVPGVSVQITLPTATGVTLQSTASTPSLGAPTLSGGVLTWTIPVLMPGQQGTVEARLMLNCTAGDIETISSAASITTPPGDPTPADNTATYSKQTLCSHDPNDKTVVPRGCGPEGYVPVGTEFEYLIQFQNTGNGPAYRVVLRDPLDPNLDLNTVQVLGGSHPAVFAIDTSTRELVWTMDNINLPGASYDEPESHGFVRFKIQHNGGAVVGTVITNQAAIYFDVNAPVLTAITTNTLTDAIAPVAAFTASPTVLLLGDAVDFTYTGGTPGASFAWDFGAGAVPGTSTDQNPSGVIYTTPGPKLPTLRVSLDGCEVEPAVALLSVAGTAPQLNIQLTGGNALLSWNNAAFHLQATPALNPVAVWTNVPGASTVTVPIATRALFFRLINH